MCCKCSEKPSYEELERGYKTMRDFLKGYDGFYHFNMCTQTKLSTILKMTKDL